MKLTADIALAPGITFRTSENDGSAEFLKKVIRQLDRYARKAKLKRSRHPVIIINAPGGKWGYSGRNLLLLPGNAAEWQIDSGSRQKIYALLASHRFNFRFPANSSGVAEWIVNGIDSELAAAETSGQFVAANRQYPLLAETTALNGKMPDFGAMCRMGIVKNPLIRDLLGEQSRLLLQISARRGSIKDVFENSCLDRNTREILRLTGADRQDSDFYADAEVILWDQYSPMPAELALKKLAALNEIYILQSDDKGNLTGNFIKCDYRKLAKILKNQRPDANKLRTAFAGGFFRLGKMLPRDEQRLCNAMAAAVSRFGLEKESKAADEFAAAMKKLRSAMDLRIKRTRFFHQTLDRNSSLPDHYGRLFQALKYSPDAGSQAELKFFRETLNNYLQ